VIGGVEVRGGVPIPAGFAAADVAADEALPQVDPGVAGLEAVLAPFGAGRDLSDLIEVGAGDVHRFLLAMGRMIRSVWTAGSVLPDAS